MRLNKYLTEAKAPDTDQFYEKVKKECSQILRIYQSTGRVFYRGVKSYQQWWKPKKVRIRSRIPKDTPKVTHDWLNGEFIKKFGWPGRNGVMAHPRKYTAEYYANSNMENVYIFMPVNRYKFIYSPDIADLYDALPGALKHWGHRDETSEELKEVLDELEDTTDWAYFKEGFDKYTDKNLKIALTKIVEVMFNPKQYYLLPAKWSDEHGERPFDLEKVLGFTPMM